MNFNKKYNYRHYQFTDRKTGQKIVVAVSTYAGRTVKGYARCASDDKFDLEKGIALAEARCNAKVAVKRYNRSLDKIVEADRMLGAATLHKQKMENYVNDSTEALRLANKQVEDLLATM